MKEPLRNALFLTAPALIFILLVLELVFRFVIPACEPPILVFDNRFELVHFKPGHSGTFTSGRFAEVRGNWRINNSGWNSGIDYVPGIGKERPLIAVIGDSFVEAFQIDCGERFPEILRRLAGDAHTVYSLGISGAPLSHYLHMSRCAREVFNPGILVINVVHNDFDESLAALRPTPKFLQLAAWDGGFAEVRPERFEHGAFLKLCRLSAVFRYIENNCQASSLIKRLGWFVKGSAPQVHNSNVDVEAVARERDLLRQATKFILNKIRIENADTRIIVQMDAPRFDIYNGSLAGSNVKWLNDMVRDICAESGIEFLDLTGPFSAHYAKHRQYFDNSPAGDAHWNRLGHQLAAEALWAKIKEE